MVQQGRENVQRATNYVLGVVLFAAVLFFSGISTKLRTAALRRVLLGFGVALFLGTAAWLARSRSASRSDCSVLVLRRP